MHTGTHLGNHDIKLILNMDVHIVQLAQCKMSASKAASNLTRLKTLPLLKWRGLLELTSLLTTSTKTTKPRVVFILVAHFVHQLIQILLLNFPALSPDMSTAPS